MLHKKLHHSFTLFFAIVVLRRTSFKTEVLRCGTAKGPSIS